MIPKKIATCEQFVSFWNEKLMTRSGIKLIEGSVFNLPREIQLLWISKDTRLGSVLILVCMEKNLYSIKTHTLICIPSKETVFETMEDLCLKRKHLGEIFQNWQNKSLLSTYLDCLWKNSDALFTRAQELHYLNEKKKKTGGGSHYDATLFSTSVQLKLTGLYGQGRSRRH